MYLNMPVLSPLLSCAFLFSGFCCAAMGDERDFLGTPHSGPREVVGLSASKCAICHAKSTNASAEDLPTDVAGRGNDGWIRGDELRTWVREDLHYQAFAVLLGEQSQQMAKRLGIVDAKGQSLVHQDRRCLACHSTVPVEQMKVNGDLLLQDTRRDSKFTIGVSCEACHGPAGNRTGEAKGWEEVHVVDPLWRTMDAKRKFEEFGYWDVHSTRTQTRICLSCHMGNVDQKKIITHEMYAAGHPPLPSFELSQFTHQLPRHWRRLDEKPKPIRDEFLKRSADAGSLVAFDPADLPITKATLIAALVTVEEAMQYNANLMGNEPGSSEWPELANYSCFACHHELQRNGWRKARRFTSVPGRPSLQEWPFALSQAAVMALGEDVADFKDKLHGVAAALDAKPFGEFNDLKQALKAMAATSEKQSRKLDAMVINPKLVEAFLKQTAQLAAAEQFLDYDSARQVVWAYERAQSELAQRSRASDGSAIPSGGDIPSKWSAQNPILQDFDQQLFLWLPAMREAGSNPEIVELYSGDRKVSHQLKVVKTADVLHRISAYQPEAIREGFKELLKRQPTVVKARD